MKIDRRISTCWQGAVLATMVLACGTAMAQQSVSLQEAIALAQKQSLEYKVAMNSYQSSVWNFRNHRASFLPTLYLDGTVPSYSRMISRITLPTGEDTFVSQNQAYSSLDLGIRQHVALTGGTISVSSSLNRIDLFGNNRQVMYSTTPASVTYNQGALGYNEFKWLKQTEPLRFESADRNFVASMEQIAAQTVEYYCNMLATQAKRSLARQNLANADTLYRISQERVRLGTVSQSELLQLRLNVLNAQKDLTQDSVDFVLARQRLLRYLALSSEEDLQLAQPEGVHFFDVSFDDALAHAYQNSQQVIDFRLQRLEAEKNLAETKATNNLTFSLYANFGLTNSAATIPALFNNFENQQNVVLRFSLPLLDWGYTKTVRQRAEANLSMVESQVEQQQMQLEQEIALHTARWNLHKQQLAVAAETRQVADTNYELEVQRFLRGSISINDLNLAQNQKDSATTAYIEAIRTYWQLYYTLRRLTLYDFEKGEKIVFSARIQE